MTLLQTARNQRFVPSLQRSSRFARVQRASRFKLRRATTFISGTSGRHSGQGTGLGLRSGGAVSAAYFLAAEVPTDLLALSITLRMNSYWVWSSRSAISIAESTTSCRREGPSPRAASA